MGSAIVLVSLPWPRIEHYSIQLGALTGYANAQGLSVVQKNYAKEIRSYVGRDLYESIALNDLQQYEATALLYPERRSDIYNLFRRVLGHAFGQAEFDDYLARCDRFYDDVSNDLSNLNPALVGFSVSFIQLMPSVLVAKRLKTLSDTPTVLGGASMLPHFSAPILEIFPQVDFIVEGEGEQTFVELSRRVLSSNNRTFADIGGLVSRCDAMIVRGPRRARLQDLDELPTPIMAGQFDAHLPAANEDKFLPTMTIEASRGCFYGKCTFCNLNCQWDNTFRAKSDAKVIEELTELCKSHKTFRFMFCDTNVSNRLDLLQKIANLSISLDLMLEVSGHGEGAHADFYAALAAAGATQIQIGIEAFSERLLRIIKKGVTVMKNVELLKWCAQHRIRCFYNMLCHIPGEERRDIEDTLRVLPFLKYFEPPSNVCDFYLAHDSPAFENPELFHIAGYRISQEIRVCYPEVIADRLSPLITAVVGFEPVPDQPFQDWSAVLDCVARWRELHKKRNYQAGIWYRDCEDFLTVETWDGARSEYFTLTGRHRELYLACEETISVTRVSEKLNLSPRMVTRMVDEFTSIGIMFSEAGRLLSLAIPSKGAAFSARQVGF